MEEDFGQVCKEAAQEGGGCWNRTRKSLKQGVRRWVKSRKTPDKLLSEVENRMASLNAQQPDLVDRDLERELQAEHDRILLMWEAYWHQRARVKWAIFGDSNSKYFHATATTRRRRNRIQAIQVGEGEWITGDREIRHLFLNHFRAIYNAGQVSRIHEKFNQQVLDSFPKIPEHAHTLLSSLPTAQEIQAAVMSLGPDKAPGPDGINARLI